jgi:hypothetical protein
VSEQLLPPGTTIVRAPTQIGFEYEICLCASIPLAWAALLKLCADHHYDYKCREAGKRGVVNALHNTALDGEFPSHHPVSWRDLDLVCKVAEQIHHHTEDLALILAIREWIDTAMDQIARRHRACEQTPPDGPAGPSDLSAPERPTDVSTNPDTLRRLALAIRGQVAQFSDQRLNDGDDVWREREIAYRRGVAETASALCFELKLDPAAFAAACGLHVSDGRDTCSDCHPGELTWEKPRGDAP